MEWLLILTIYQSKSISVAAIKTPSVKACTKAGASWVDNVKNDLKFINASYTCSPMIKDK